MKERSPEQLKGQIRKQAMNPELRHRRGKSVANMQDYEGRVDTRNVTRYNNYD